MFEVVALENVYYWHVSLTGRASSILHDGLNDADLKASKYCSISRVKKGSIILLLKGQGWRTNRFSHMFCLILVVYLRYSSILIQSINICQVYVL